MATSHSVLVDPDELSVSHQLLSGLPVVNAALDRLGLFELVQAHLGEPDPRCSLEPARVIGVLVRTSASGASRSTGSVPGHGATTPRSSGSSGTRRGS